VERGTWNVERKRLKARAKIRAVESWSVGQLERNKYSRTWKVESGTWKEKD